LGTLDSDLDAIISSLPEPDRLHFAAFLSGGDLSPAEISKMGEDLMLALALRESLKNTIPN